MIRSFLDLSTGHVSKDTAAWLDKQGILAAEYLHFECPHPALVIGRLTTGWFIYADEEPNDEVLPADLIQVMKYARSQGCEYILFDRDAAVISNLPSYDW